ncbi:ArnT family glycosyltransferase [Haloarchaeobius amylolyticus]|uniref:ArnT family glycosyltransferase n=1 Tax=Haloarchaeobius amylolyticus TaxID=1198296 RepID=A0ABD6BCL7_9EURY
MGNRTGLNFDFPRPAQWKRPPNIILIIAVGILARLLIFDIASVNADTGLYLYDAQRFLEGGIPIADFPSRSPFFHAILSSILLTEIDPIVTTRLAMISISAMSGFGVYKIVDFLSGQKPAEFATILYLLTPLPLFWSLWLKTEPALVLLTIMVSYIYVSRFTEERVRLIYLFLVGILLGSGYLIRRSAIFYAVLIGLHFLYYRTVKRDEHILKEIPAVVVLASSMLTTILGGYVIISRGDLSATAELATYHLFGLMPLSPGPLTSNLVPYYILISVLAILVSSYIHSSDTYYSLFPSNMISPINQVIIGVASIGIISLLLITPEFSYQSIKSDMQEDFILGIIYLSLPIFLIFMVYLFTYIRSSNINKHASVLAYLTLTGIMIQFLKGIYTPSYPLTGYQGREVLVGVISILFITAILVTMFLPDINLNIFQEENSSFLIILPVGISAMYIFRDDPMLITYSQEILPYLSIISGIAVGQLREATSRFAFHGIAFILALSAVVGVLAAPVMISNMGGTVQPYDSDRGSISNVQAVGDLVEKKTSENDLVFTAQPLYAIQADRENVQDFSREWGDYRNGEGQQVMTNKIVDSMEKGEVVLVIKERRTEMVMKPSDEIRTTFESHYCRIDNDRLELSKAQIYIHKDYGC